MQIELETPEAAARRYSLGELLVAARERGFHPTKRMLTDWVAIGLIDKGADRGRGKGAGKEYSWSYEQLRLFLSLLEQAPKVKRSTLLHMPVLLWLIWGDAFVPLRQVRRAMSSWLGVRGRSGIGAARKTAREVLRHLDHPDAAREDRQRLVELVAQSAYRADVDRAELLAVAERIFNPHGQDLSDSRAPMTPDNYVRVLDARLHAMAEIENLPDELFIEARLAYQATGPSGDLTRAALNQDARLTMPGPQLTALNRAGNFACLDLLTLLGLLDRTPDRLPLDRRPSWPAPKGHRLKR